MGESGKVVLQVSVTVFRALTKLFSGKDGSAPPPEKMARTNICAHPDSLVGWRGGQPLAAGRVDTSLRTFSSRQLQRLDFGASNLGSLQIEFLATSYDRLFLSNSCGSCSALVASIDLDHRREALPMFWPLRRLTLATYINSHANFAIISPTCSPLPTISPTSVSPVRC